MKVTESYGKYAVGSFHDTINHIILCNSFSGFPSTNYAKYYTTKRKSVKMPSEDSSLQLISYSPIFASNFRIAVTAMVPSWYYQDTHFLAPYLWTTND